MAIPPGYTGALSTADILRQRMAGNAATATTPTVDSWGTLGPAPGSNPWGTSGSNPVATTPTGSQVSPPPPPPPPPTTPPISGETPQVGNLPLPTPPKTDTPDTPAQPDKPTSHWDQDAAALWKSIGEGFDAGLKSQQSAIAAQTSGLERRNIEMGALRGNTGLGGAAQAGSAQAVLTGAQMQSDAIAGNEKQKLGAKMAMLQMYMDRAKADDNLEAQKQIQAMMDETSIAMALAQGGGIDYTQIQNLMGD